MNLWITVFIKKELVIQIYSLHHQPVVLVKNGGISVFGKNCRIIVIKFLPNPHCTGRRNAVGEKVPSGIYIARLSIIPPTAGVTPEYTKSIKMLLLR